MPRNDGRNRNNSSSTPPDPERWVIYEDEALDLGRGLPGNPHRTDPVFLDEPVEEPWDANPGGAVLGVIGGLAGAALVGIVLASMLNVTMPGDFFVEEVDATTATQSLYPQRADFQLPAGPSKTALVEQRLQAARLELAALEQRLQRTPPPARDNFADVRVELEERIARLERDLAEIRANTGAASPSSERLATAADEMAE